MVTAADPAAPGPRKIAVLGGGMGALSAVYELTRETDWKTRYDITVYQIGWRLGGKGASGRNMAPEFHHRIEEHGVHVFFGFYTNAFRLMESCYKELGRPPGSPLATWQDAFKGFNQVVLPEQMPDGEWEPWAWNPPPGTGQPTDDRSDIQLQDVILTVARWFNQVVKSPFAFGKALPFVASPQAMALKMKLELHEDVIVQLAKVGLQSAEKISAHSAELKQNLPLSFTAAAPLADFADEIDQILLGTVAAFKTALKLYWTFFEGSITAPDSAVEREMRRTWILGNFMYANLAGILDSGVLQKGIEVLNHRDYIDWLKEHALEDNGATVHSVLTRWIYDAVFSYRSGDITKPSLEAGTTLLTLLRILLTYGGDFVYKMQSGMGDVVFAPLYEVLLKRKVKFEFFHRVLALEVGKENGKDVISAIKFERQAAPRADLGHPYDPLVEVKDRQGKTLRCWPAEPNYDQLENGAALKQALPAQGPSLEAYSPSPHQQTFSLARGQFDDVVLGIGLGAATQVCPQLIAASPDWENMVNEVGTVATLGAQLWMRRDLAALATGPLTRQAIFCGFDYDKAPIDTYADMTQVLPRESWPTADSAPRSIAYFCSPLNDVPATEGLAGAKQVRTLTLTMLQQQIRIIWPGSLDAAGKFDWNLLVDLRNAPGQGQARLDAQYFVGVANPSDRYVATFHGSSRNRLWPHRSGFVNLILTGDWVRNTFNIGCIEATVMSGMQAANVVRGLPLGDGIAGWGLLSSDRP